MQFFATFGGVLTIGCIAVLVMMRVRRARAPRSLTQSDLGVPADLTDTPAGPGEEAVAGTELAADVAVSSTSR